jgi:hypothetical protein
MKVFTRREAANLNLHKYFTGKPCQKGHLALRYTNTGCCVSCIKGYAQAYKSSLKGRTKIIRAVVDSRDEADILKYIESVRSAREFEDS